MRECSVFYIDSFFFLASHQFFDFQLSESPRNIIFRSGGIEFPGDVIPSASKRGASSSHSVLVGLGGGWVGGKRTTEISVVYTHAEELGCSL
jgi:acetyl esterase/lipase